MRLSLRAESELRPVIATLFALALQSGDFIPPVQPHMAIACASLVERVESSERFQIHARFFVPDLRSGFGGDFNECF